MERPCEMSVVTCSDRITPIPLREFIPLSCDINLRLLPLFEAGDYAPEAFQEHTRVDWCGWTVPKRELAQTIDELVQVLTDGVYEA